MVSRQSELFAKIRAIIDAGEIDAGRRSGSGFVGTLFEELLGAKSGNEPSFDLPGHWEVKTSSSRGATLLTMFHLSPNRRDLGDTMGPLVRNFGWKPTRGDYPPDTLSFRATVGGDWNERGFRIEVLDDLARLRFDAARVKDAGWLESVVARCGGRLSPPPPQWTRDEIFRAAGAKLRNVILANAQIREKRYVTFTGALVYRNLQLSKFWRGLEEGWILIDFDARTQGRGLRDHGTKFRVDKRNFARLYESSEEFPSKRTQISSS